jgi:hypothetical protein
MEDLREVALTYLRNCDTDLPIEQQILLAFGAGTVYGSNTILSVVESKALLIKMDRSK